MQKQPFKHQIFLPVSLSVSFRAGNVEGADFNARAVVKMSGCGQTKEPSTAVGVNQMRCHLAGVCFSAALLLVKRCSRFREDMVHEKRQHERVVLKEFAGPELQLESELFPCNFLHDLGLEFWVDEKKGINLG